MYSGGYVTDQPGERPVLINWALLAVPQALLPRFNREIERYLGLTPSAGDEPVGSPILSETEETEKHDRDVWTDDLLSQFAATGRRGGAIGIVVRVMDICAERPEEPIPTSELLRLLEPHGVQRGQLKMAWTHLSRHLKSHYRHNRWPLTGEWGPSIGRASSEVYYHLSTARAQQWKRLRGL